MTKTVISLAALLLSAAILLVGNGLQNTFLAVRSNLEGFPLSLTGLLLSSYYAGFIVGCHVMPAFVMRAGHIRAFTAFASIASTSALVHLLIVEPVSWLALRAVSGFCFAGLTMIVESWMNEKATNENRGSVLSIYRILDFSAATAGQWLLTLSDPRGFSLFVIISILISLSLVPLALTTSTAPRPLTRARLNLAKLMAISPLAAIGALCVGLANGAFWAIGPVYVLQIGYGVGEVAAFMSAVIVAGALAQWPWGRLSDLTDRRSIIVGVSALAGMAGVVMYFAGALSSTYLLLGAGLFGLFALPMFGLCVAHANDFADADEYVLVNGGLLLLFGVGAVIGPVVVPFMMEGLNANALFLYTASVHFALAVYGLYRMTRRPSVRGGGHEPYVPVPRTSPEVFELDPRSGEAARRTETGTG